MIDQEFQKVETIDDARIFMHRYIITMDGLTPSPEMILELKREYCDVLASLIGDNPDVDKLIRVANNHLGLANLRPLYVSGRLLLSPMNFIGGVYFRIILKMTDGYKVKQCPRCGIYFMDKRRAYCSPRCQSAYNTNMLRLRRKEGI